MKARRRKLILLRESSTCAQLDSSTYAKQTTNKEFLWTTRRALRSEFHRILVRRDLPRNSCYVCWSWGLNVVSMDDRSSIARWCLDTA